MKKAAILCACLMAALVFPAGGPVSASGNNPAQNIVSTAPVANAKTLVRDADVIAYGWFDSADREVETGRHVSGGRLVNFTQTFHMIMPLKGSARRLIRVLSTGIEPLPLPEHPLNKTYPGPMAEGRYVCFLKKIAGSDLYSIIGGWQGVYPVIHGKTIALEGAGFKEFGELTPDELKRKLSAP